MNPIVQKIQSSQRHKKATSTFHMTNHYPLDFEIKMGKQKDEQNNLQQRLKRAKSFSKDSNNIQSHPKNYVSKLNHIYLNEVKEASCRHSKKFKNQKIIKQNKQDFLRDFIKSESESRKYKKNDKRKIDLVQSKVESKSKSKSARKFKVLKQQQKNFKFKPESKQRKNFSKQISLQKKSKDSKGSKNQKHQKSQNVANLSKINKRDSENKLARQKKGIEINFKNISLKNQDQASQIYPMTPDQVAEKFKQYFTENQINQMKEYKLIYFLGKDLEQGQSNIIFSARQNLRKNCQQQQSSQQKEVTYHYFQTENLVHQKKRFAEEEDNQSQFYTYKMGDQIAFRYQIVSSINRGSFGEVLKVFDHKTKQFLAIKIVKKSKELVHQTFVQISILTHIKQSDKGNTSGIVRIKDFLLFRNHICIIFQLLDGNLYELLTANGFKGFTEDVIRLFSVQILNSLNFLRRQKIIHCDIKPENLVMKNWGKSGIKLIDFGTSCFEGKQMYSYLQSRYYRAPQVFMQMPYSFSIDMWSFGCMIAELKMGEPLFGGRSTMEQLVYIVSCIGRPNKNDGLFSLAFLQNQLLKQVLDNNYIDHNRQNGFGLGENLFFKKYNKKLKDQCMLNLQERLARKGSLNFNFIDFIEKIILWQPNKRLTPEEALRHPWITNGLSSQIYSLYSSFNTAESCSKSKKNSKESKKSNESKSKSNQNGKGLRQKNTIKISFNQKKQDENKINFGSKKKGESALFLDKKDLQRKSQ